MKYVYICHGNPWVSGDGWEMTQANYHPPPTGGGVKVFLSVHTKKVWSEVGSVPVTSWTTEEDVQQAVKDAPVLGNSMLPTTIERLESEERDIGTL